MKRIPKMPSEVDLFAQLADLKEVDYKNTLVITAVVELLVEKGILERRDVIQKAKQLDHNLSLEIDRIIEEKTKH
ncbi:hypothetical protein DNHGIG_13970 [Collibacillus ludicampi]|uniref:Uncharacterized protein n=1 Tax=Collibacillus ludicampi TaxID=2771369 RepID=A0AAV4LDL0_9BACL|nr:hypothetical protein [Collibacillus ludicampi]GIM45848.1 hypothetical protein DNHGIG_13970 [Collibacillus ludicampi]